MKNKKCRLCGTEFHPDHPARQYCKPTHKYEAQLRQMMEWYHRQKPRKMKTTTPSRIKTIDKSLVPHLTRLEQSGIIKSVK